MAKRTTPPTASDEEVRVLLERYCCPLPLYAVRTRFLGNIASPNMQASLIKTVEARGAANCRPSTPSRRPTN
jgi:hypothetical protein